jgi:hypothetical protein
MALPNGVTTIQEPGRVKMSAAPEQPTNGLLAASFVSERPVDSARPLKVRVAGAGVSGIIAAIKLREAVQDLDIELFDKNEDLGGTWFENRYPGCACG